MKFRDATLADLPAIVDIYNSVIPSRKVTADTELISIADRQHWFSTHTPLRPLWIVETEDDHLIGWVSFQDFYGRPAYKSTAEISIYLASTQRRKGYGKMILDYCTASVTSLGIKTLLGFIFSHNLESIMLFEAAGFQSWALLPNIAELDGIERSLQIFGKRIT